jgi:predicted NBD/HSP70 family sugar kinase
MYLAIDVGGTKTLLAVFSEAGEVVAKQKIPTNHDYAIFLQDIEHLLTDQFQEHQFTHCCCAVPGTIDFENGIALAFGSENWLNVPITKDLERLLPNSKVIIHNDAKLAGLSEARLIANQYDKILYLTISTGIGGGVVQKGVIDSDFENFEPGQMVFEVSGQAHQWEDIASGRALRAKYGKLASEITDPKIWQEYSHLLTYGFENLIATIKPDAIIVGGSVGAHLEQYKDFLVEELKKFNNPLVPIPPILKAQRPEEAVIYGCYELIKQHN